MNLWQETTSNLKDNGKSWSDVIWIGGDNFEIPINNFEQVSNFDYDNGHGSPKIATDLKIVGRDWWLERHEYDGSEWWEFKSLPSRPHNTRTVERVGGNQYMWCDLQTIADREDY